MNASVVESETISTDTDSLLPVDATRKEILSEEDRYRIKQLHQHGGGTMLRQQLNNLFGLGMCFLGLYLWHQGLWPLLVICWVVQAHFFHTKPLSLHDASHGTLHYDRRKNEMFGILCGTVSLVPISVYRHAHAYHHGFMSTERDPEMWPFNKPGTSWFFRMTCAILEIFCGCLYTPFLFIRSLFVLGPLKKAVKKRVLMEYGLIVLFWGSIAAILTWRGWWPEFFIAFGIPYAIAGMYQTLNKYTEHMGLFGDSVLSGTRTVIPRRLVDKTLSNMMQHVDHHGTHHRYARIPFYSLPLASPIVYGDRNPRNPVYSTYAGAFFAMLPTLLNPKAGSQWLKDKTPQPQ
ncbi:MAG: fatty acid desaturase [Planctomycetaceae bacterium]|nr:fatty acid desaturase [Planctomycetaceae bacterium]